jgi:2-polyprenyl-6-methoxyphenol hydroxylase-like FAD-dependent oxidoreductase
LSNIAESGPPSSDADVVIVGAGLAGTLAAILLGRAGLNVSLVDRSAVYPPDFRAEQLVGYQVEMLAKLGLLDIVVADTVPADRAVCIRGRRPVGVVTVPHYGIAYETMVNRARQHLPESVRFINARVVDIIASPDRQRIVLADGEAVTGRLAIIATGLGRQLLAKSGIGKTADYGIQVLAFGFDLEVEAPAFFDKSVLVVQGEKPADKIDYLTLFGIGSRIRGNLFTYHEPDDPLTYSFRRQPRETLLRAMPGIADITGKIRGAGPVEYRVVDLVGSTGHRRDGVVLVGDAFQISSPAAGTGVSRLLSDIELLCHAYIPGWLATSGMGAGKIGQFYDDRVKQSSDAEALRVAGYRRAVTVETNLRWRAHRSRVALQNQIRSRLARLAGQLQAGPAGMAASWLGPGVAPPPLH